MGIVRGMGGVFDEPEGEAPGTIERPTQRVISPDPYKDVEFSNVVARPAKDGLPIIDSDGSPAEPEEGLTEDNFICAETANRPACKHYKALLVPADGVARGFEEMRQIRRFCTLLASTTELFELTTNVYACTGRDPIDPRSASVIRAFEDEQRRREQDRNEDNRHVDL